MKGKRMVLGCAVMVMMIASGSMANEIYKHVAEDGTVSYEDRPTGAPGERRLDVSYRRTDSSAVQARVQARVDAQTTREEARSMEAAAEKEAADNRAAEAERQQRCESARARLETYLQARHLYRTKANGERVYLDEQQMREARGKVEEQIAEDCS